MSAADLREVHAVVIGTSSGGVEALSQLLPAIPADTRCAVLIVIHLPRERPSLLVSIFQPRCTVRIREAEDKEPIEPATVYFAPPDYHLLVDAGPRIALSTDDLVNYSRPSIDVLFESAADVYREHVLGILLTGASRDGALGMEAISRAGGWTLAQHPDTAQMPLMIEAALARQVVDEVMPLDRLAVTLAALPRRTTL